MQKRFLLPAGFFFLFLLFAFKPPPGKDIRVFAIGNGNMADCPLTSDDRGWMQMLPMFFDTNIQFHNYGIRNKDVCTFLREGHLDAVLSQLRKGDYVFIAFDQESLTCGPGRGAYPTAMLQIISAIESKDAVPVLFTPAVKENKDENDWDSRRSPIETLAEKNHVICIDLETAIGSVRTTTPVHPFFANDKPFLTSGLSIYEAIEVAKIAAGLIKDKMPGFRAEVNDRAGKRADIIAAYIKYEAARDFNLRQLPVTKSAWLAYRKELKARILEASGAIIDHTLPLDYHETGSIKMDGYSIRKIYFQTRPGIYATANLYVPEGKGPFPAVINMHGHWANGKAGEMVQSCAHELVLNGYVCLNIDAWGSGERTTIHGVQEYHGANLGASLMNIGESLLGNQLTDNMRGVDLLCSLPYVDKNNIGATGASGGGNQTMWLSAIDERIKASMPVVSVGTFQSYILGSNCVCELLPDGLTFTEESGVLALIAPRAVKICSGLEDANPAFSPQQMIRSYTNAKPVFALYNKEDHIQYQLFNTPHGYWPEMRLAMLSWFDLQLKGNGSNTRNNGFRRGKPFSLLPPEKLMVFPVGKRSPRVVGTADYCIRRGKVLSGELERQSKIDAEKKREELAGILLLGDKPGAALSVKAESAPACEPGGGWQHFILEANGEGPISIASYTAAKRENAPVVIICSGGDTGGEADRTDTADRMRKSVVEGYVRNGYIVVEADIWGIGSNTSEQASATDGNLPPFHTLSRSELWLGHTIMGIWVDDINAIVRYVQQKLRPSSLTVDAAKEIAVAALFQSALYNNVDSCILRDCPVSYVLDRREGIDFFNMAIHVPHFLQWGDISLAIALNNRAKIIFNDPVSITGAKIMGRRLDTCKEQFSALSAACGNRDKNLFSFIIKTKDHE